MTVAAPGGAVEQVGAGEPTSAKINRNTSHDLAVIAVRLLDDAHMTWVAAWVESEHAAARDLQRLLS